MNTLTYSGFINKESEIIFSYKYNDSYSSRKLTLDKKFINGFELKALEGYLHLVGVALALHYFNSSYFDELVLETLSLKEFQISFLEKTIEKGLAEFRYVNNIDIKKKTKVTPLGRTPLKFSEEDKLEDKAILLNGGGKDSATSAELLKEIELEFVWFSLNDNHYRKKIRSVSGVEETLIYHVSRDDSVNKKHSGHKPLNFLLACLGTLAARLNKYNLVISSNEFSANFPTLVEKGYEINHQYSKSFEFEKDFSEFLEKSNSKIKYFSLLRELYELQIAKVFSKYENYHLNFVSCNRSKKTKHWCKECAKCAFILIATSGFIKKEVSFSIFGEDVFINQKLVDHIANLCDDNRAKPFECVGTKEECRLALRLTLEILDEDKAYKFLWNLAASDEETNNSLSEILRYKTRENIIPKAIHKKLQNVLKVYLNTSS